MKYMKQPVYVYRYIDKKDNIIKYIGIAKNVAERISQHKSDKWAIGKTWIIDVLRTDEPLNRTSALILESHLISLYGTGAYCNKAQVSDGLGQFLSNIPEDFVWDTYKIITITKKGEDSKTLKTGEYKTFFDIEANDDNDYSYKNKQDCEPLTTHDKDMKYTFCLELLSLDRQIEAGLLMVPIDDMLYNKCDDIFFEIEDIYIIINSLKHKTLSNDERRLILNKLNNVASMARETAHNSFTTRRELCNDIKNSLYDKWHKQILTSKERITRNIYIKENSIGDEHWDAEFLPKNRVEIDESKLYKIHL